MKPDYKNWVPTGMVVGFWIATAFAAILSDVFAVLGFTSQTLWEIILFAVFAVLTLALLVFSVYMLIWHNTFSYTGKRQMSKHIVEGVADLVRIHAGGTCLDVGCGSGALSIAVAKRNPNATVVGVDRWGKDYASFSRELCKKNAMAEGVKNIAFDKGDATALKFSDEMFDAVTSNYVYHNIPSKDRQSILLETLRVLKKGGTFAIHDIFCKAKYGDMQAFVRKLKSMGYEKVELIDTTKGKFMSEKEAKFLFLSGSAILFGKK
ncbi:MAG: class I SAM-dependent methyltransferase [Clostridia bacterium]|nr:class I SAM-dependent methyltransferase [Clostridia bacterium]